jgi:hypothetical protein
VLEGIALDPGPRGPLGRSVAAHVLDDHRGDPASVRNAAVSVEGRVTTA